MKPILLTLSAIAFTVAVFGQSARLVAIAYYNAAPSPTFRDSVSYTYSSNRGSQLKIPLVPGSGLQLIPYLKDPTNTDISFDTSWEFYYRSQKKYNQYSADGKIVESGVIDTAGTKLNKTLYSYDNLGNLIQLISQTWNDTFHTWENSSLSLYTYNNKKKLISLYQQWNSSFGWVTRGKDSTSWAGTNPAFHIYWMIDETDTQVNSFGNYHFDNTGRLDSCHLVFLPNSTYPTVEEQRYRYNGNNPVLYIDGTNHAPIVRIVSGVYDNNGNRLVTIDSTVVYQQAFNPQIYTNKERTTVTYNNYNQPLIQTRSYWDTSASVYVDEDITRYYYESYLPGSGATSSSPAISIMPNPSKDHLHFEIAWSATHHLTIAITDVAGKTLTTLNPVMADKFIADIDIQPYSAGMYFMTVQDVDGHRWTERFEVIE